MTRQPSDLELRKLWFRAKLTAEKQKAAVVEKVKEGEGDFVLLDARDRASYRAGHIPGALSMPLDEIEKLAGTLRHDIEYVTYCWSSSCQLAAKAALQLAERGLDVKELNVGWSEWVADKLPTEKGVGGLDSGGSLLIDLRANGDS
jgi:rhodanese-related sulfurtransferase